MENYSTTSDLTLYGELVSLGYIDVSEIFDESDIFMQEVGSFGFPKKNTGIYHWQHEIFPENDYAFPNGNKNYVSDLASSQFNSIYKHDRSLPKIRRIRDFLYELFQEMLETYIMCLFPLNLMTV